MKIDKTMCFCCHKTENVPVGIGRSVTEQHIFAAVDREIENGKSIFMFSVCNDFELMCAEQVLLRKRKQIGDEYKKLTLVAVVPYEGYTASFDEDVRDRIFGILSVCDNCIYLCDEDADVDRFMIDRSSKMMCFYDGGSGDTGYSLFYADATGCETLNLYDVITEDIKSRECVI